MATNTKQPAKAAEAKSKSKPAGTDALAKLKSDHDAVKKLFDKFEKSKDEMSNDEKEALVADICMELTVHAQIEEELFYPAVRDAADEDLDELLDEAEVEHTGAKDLIAQLDGANAGDDLFDAKVSVLGEQIKHHAGEEENEMFPKVRKTDIDLKALGDELTQRAEELKADLTAAA
jgi:hemerythrin superfamily protein